MERVLTRIIAAGFALSALVVVAAGCGGAEPSGEGAGDESEDLGTTREPLTAHCQANVTGIGTLDTETQYLPNVVHCENGGAPFEALKAQAIAARTFLYYKLETAGSIGDGQGDQVYSCGSTANALQKKAVLDTAGIVLRYKQQTIASFYVAGGAATAPACIGGSATTEHYVTYNQGLSGAALHQTTLGWVSTTNTRNRGCMSQLGSRCLATAGQTAAEILRFYYGADIALEVATGPCVAATTPPPPPPPPSTTSDAGAPVESDAAPAPDSPADDPSAETPAAETPAAETAGAAPGTALARRGIRALGESNAGCAVSSRRSASPAPFALLALAAALTSFRRRRRQGCFTAAP
jgi:MYXO-CTERM domain-containing protein